MDKEFKTMSHISDFLHKASNLEETLKLIYVLKAWQTMDSKIKIEDSTLTFESFYTQKIDLKKLETIFKKLAKSNKLFQLYHFQPRLFQVNELEKIITYVSKNQLPSIGYAFFDEKLKARRGEYTPSNQVVELGLKLLQNRYEELYVPFTNGFSYASHTNQMIYSENKFTDNEFLAEIINILEDKEIMFVSTDPLKHPSFTELNAPHLLKQFDAVLSFPPFGVKGKLDSGEDKYQRFNFHRGTNLDVANFEHILAQTKSKAVVLMPVGFTFRGSSEEKFREYLIEQNYLEAIIQLPPNLHSATSIETTFFIINKQKNNDKVHFINLKDESFITRSGRKLIFKSLDDIVDIYNGKKEIDNISIVASNEKIRDNSHSLAIDRYVVSKEAKELKELLSSYETIQLQEIAEIRKSQLFKDEGDGKEVYELSPSDFSKAGFTKEAKKLKKIGSQYKKYETYKLQAFDVLVSTKGTIGKVAIINKVSEPILASQASQVIRVKDKETAIELYMFFKSDIGQGMLKQLVAGSAMPQIATSEIKKLQIPVLSEDEKKQVVLNFNNEIKMYNEIKKIEQDINQIHTNFLEDK